MGEKPVGMAIVGIGMWCKALANAMQKSPAFKIITCFTRTKAKRDEFAATYHCDQENCYEEVLKRKDVEGVLITTPNSSHAEIAVQAAYHGKHVLVEKPIANQIRDAQRMIEACQQNGVVLSVLHNQRRLAGYRKMRAMVEAGDLGRVVMVETNFSNNSGFRLTPGLWRWYEEECPGGPMMTLGVHPADTLQYLLGPIHSLCSFFDRLCLNTEINDTGSAILRFESGAQGYLGSNFITPWVNYCNLYGTEANLYFTVELPTRKPDEKPGQYGDIWNQADKYSELYIKRKRENGKKRIELEYGEILREEIEEFADCLRKRKKPETGGPEGMRALAVILAAIRSAQLGKPVEVAEILAGEG
ncbi:MAG: Gfo/Idh/MocA family oxidoreductase [Deltaproteobacteria bacterium]|nr:Gfo/Idh/MocA family oxidoreductase [Deltaproteobacteria bacterium]